LPTYIIHMWVFFGLASALFLGVYDIFKKLSLNNNAVIPVLFFSTIFSSVIFIPLIILSNTIPEFVINLGLYVPELTAKEHAQIFLKSLIVVSSWILSFFALKNLPITIVAPIRATSPLWTLIGRFLFFRKD
jgi:transporter family protein